MITLFYTSLALLAFSVLFILLRRPKQNRDWVPEHAVLAQANIDVDSITIKNIVNADYQDRYTCSVTHRSKTFRLEDLESVWLLVEYFPIQIIGPIFIHPAHLLLTFGLKDGDFISISIAGRRKKGDVVSFARILPHRNELIYKVINEANTLYARSLFKKENIHLFKVKTSAKQRGILLLSVLSDLNKLCDKPRWFDTFTHNCTTETAKHLRKAGIKVPIWRPSYILTMGVDKLFYKFGLIDTSKSFSDLLASSNITHQLQKLGKNAELSKEIRKSL